MLNILKIVIREINAIKPRKYNLHMHQNAQSTKTNNISGVGYMNVPCAILSSFFFNMYEYFS